MLSDEDRLIVDLTVRAAVDQETVTQVVAIHRRELGVARRKKEKAEKMLADAERAIEMRTYALSKLEEGQEDE